MGKHRSSDMMEVEREIKSIGSTKPDRNLDPWFQADDLDIEYFKTELRRRNCGLPEDS